MSASAQEAQLIESLKNGHKDAVGLFVRMYGAFIYNVCYQVLQHRQDAEEATQDSVMKVIRALDSYQSASPFKAWCYTIAYRTAIDHQRKRRNFSELSDVAPIQSADYADHLLNNQDTESTVRKLLSALDEESRVIVSLFYLEEKNIKEVAVVTGLTESNIKIKLFRARKFLAANVALLNHLIP